jgi:hypothetical protein
MPDTAIQKVLTAAEITAKFKPNRTRIVLCLDTDIVLEMERLEEQLEEARRDDELLNRDPQAIEIAHRIIELRERAKAAEVEFVFRGIGRVPFRDLVARHPATEEQREKATEQRPVNWNVDTFMPALLAAAAESVAPGDLEFWTDACATWEDGRVALLFGTAYSAQEGYTEIPKADLAYALTGTSPSKSG